MVWMLVGALGVLIAEEFHLTAAQKGLLVAVPLLSGAMLRLPVGMSSDYFGPKMIGLLVLTCELLAVLWGWRSANSYAGMLGIGAALGAAGASFAVALPLASRVYPPVHQGLAMGIAASANSGTVLAAFFAPRLGEMVGWRGVFGLMAVPLLLVIVLFTALVRSDRTPVDHRTGSQWWNLMTALFRQPSMYWLCFLYGVTFGGFVGFSSFLPIFFHDQYGMSLVTAGTITAICGLVGSLARPVGGYAADRAGGVRMLVVVFPLIAAMTVGMAYLPFKAVAVPLMVAAVAAMGFGNGVAFQVVSDRFQKQIGAASGLIGAAGGVGGFLLPVWLGVLKEATGTYGAGFAVFALVSAVAGSTAVRALKQMRRSSDSPAAGFVIDSRERKI
jgi:NNP family nitrate/nitrite transporter-like MFS transporter